MKEKRKDSTALRLIKEGKKGYRIEKESAFIASDLKEVLLYEFKEVGRMDVLEYLYEKYDFDIWEVAEKAYQSNGGNFNSYCTKKAIMCKNENKELSFSNFAGDFFQKEAEVFATETVSYIEKMMGQRNLKGIYLSPKMKIADILIQNHMDLSIRGTFEVPDDAIVLLDNQDEPILFAMEEIRLID